MVKHKTDHAKWMVTLYKHGIWIGERYLISTEEMNQIVRLATPLSCRLEITYVSGV